MIDVVARADCKGGVGPNGETSAQTGELGLGRSVHKFAVAAASTLELDFGDLCISRSPSLLLELGEIYMATRKGMGLREWNSKDSRLFMTKGEGREWMSVIHVWNRIIIELHQLVHDHGRRKRMGERTSRRRAARNECVWRLHQNILDEIDGNAKYFDLSRVECKIFTISDLFNTLSSPFQQLAALLLARIQGTDALAVPTSRAKVLRSPFDGPLMAL
jgi:hypothetical protein